MNLDVLMNFYKNDPRCFQIADRVTLSKPTHTHLSGLYGSASQFLIAAVYSQPAVAQTNHLVILRDPEEAAYFQNTLENITNALDIFYFPSSFKNKKNAKYSTADYNSIVVADRYKNFITFLHKKD